MNYRYENIPNISLDAFQATIDASEMTNKDYTGVTWDRYSPTDDKGSLTISFDEELSVLDRDILERLVANIRGGLVISLLPQTNQPHDAENKPYVRAESRPLDCTTCFTTCGDLPAQGSIPPVIGGGDRLDWDASVSEQWTTEGAPSGMKQRKVDIQFCDSIWLKEGTVYFNNGPKGGYVDMEVLCPPGGYYMYLGEVKLNDTGDWLVVNHYVIKSTIEGDAPMGDELNTETCSEEIPSYMKFRMTITIPTSDVNSHGVVQMEVYRKRTVVV